MKKLILVRHAKSSWEYSVKDEDRPLKVKGIDRANRISKLLKQRLGFIPEIWLSSYANRALHTASIFAQEFNCLSKLQVNSDLYTFSSGSLETFVKNLDNEWNSVILFGHNEAITQFSNHMGTKHVDNVPTAGVVFLKFEVDNWNEIQQGETEFVIIPKKVI